MDHSLTVPSIAFNELGNADVNHEHLAWVELKKLRFFDILWVYVIETCY